MKLCSGCAGFLVLFLSDWEASVSENDLDFQLYNQLPLIKAPVNAFRFTELVYG